MKPNGKYFVVNAFVLALCAVAVFSAVGNAETVRGKFKLARETRWGRIVLAPGEYEFHLDCDASGRIVRVLSTDSGWSAMILATAWSDATAKHGSSLEMAQSEGGLYVKTLYMGDLGVALNFSVPKRGRGGRLTEFTSATPKASASGRN